MKTAEGIGKAPEAQEFLFPEALSQPALFSAPNGFRLPHLGTSPLTVRLLDTLLHVAPTEATILLRGETGVGKGFLARLIHKCSPRAGKPFIHLVCGTLPESLIESELFGHERGAFSGADSSKPGRFELAKDGTIFLDEIADLALPMQIKLLRILQDREFERVGGVVTLTSHARIVVATNRDLRALVRRGQFREDLYHRLNVVELELPPLRKRPGDIPFLARTFLREFGERHRGTVPTITSEAVDLLCRYSWPGNVRDLKNCVERLVVLDRRGAIDAEDLPLEIRGGLTQAAPTDEFPSAIAEKEALLLSLLHCRNNKKAASKQFGKSRSHFYRLLKRHGLR